VLVTAQVMLSVVLLASVGLFLKSLILATSQPLGFQPDHVLTVRINFPWNTADDRLIRFYDRAIDEFAAIPGVRAVGVVDRLPLGGGAQSGPIGIRGRTLPPDLEQREASFRIASPGYFAAIGIPLKAGRLYEQRAKADERLEAVINETFARLYFPEGGAIGSFITYNPKPAKGEKQRWFQIVGIVGDVPMELKQRSQMAETFVLPRDGYWPMANFALRAQGTEGALAVAVRAAVGRIDPNQIIDSISTMTETVAAHSGEDWILVRLLGGFALTALLLAAIGMYGLLASDVAQRQKEIGVRIALGADPKGVARMFAGHGLKMAVAGLVLGFVFAGFSGRFIASLLFGVEPVDPAVYGVAAIVLLAVAAVASWLPARRAARVDPIAALREE
jgi:predicted permease